MTPVRALIVDDEPLARTRLERLLRRREDVEVVGIAAGGDEALTKLGALLPDLIFLDIQMPGLDGFDVLREIRGGGWPFVIFTTAHAQHALRAFEVHALDYLLKPFDEERLSAALDRALPMIRGSAWTERIIVKSAGRIMFLSANDVSWIAAAENYVYLHVGRASHLVRTSLKALEQRLDPARFVRVHRSAIVNVAFIAELQSLDHGDYEVVLSDGAHVVASRTFSERLRALTVSSAKISRS
jgi:two-component system LytT family response regulator